MSKNNKDKLTTLSYIKYVLKTRSFLSPKPLEKMTSKEIEDECRYNRAVGEK